MGNCISEEPDFLDLMLRDMNDCSICKLSSSIFAEFVFAKSLSNAVANDVYCINMRWIDEKMFKYIKNTFNVAKYFRFCVSVRIGRSLRYIIDDPMLMYYFFLNSYKQNFKSYVIIHIPKQQYDDIFAFRIDHTEEYKACTENIMSHRKIINEITIVKFQKNDVANNWLLLFYAKCIQQYADDIRSANNLQSDDLVPVMLKLNDEKMREEFVKNELVICRESKFFAVLPRSIIIQIATENNIMLISEEYKKISNNLNNKTADTTKDNSATKEEDEI